MIQVFEENIRPQQQTFLDRLGKGLYGAGQAAGQLIPEYMQKQKQQQQSQDQAQKLSNFLGFDVSQYSPEAQQKLLDSALKGNLMEQEYGLKSFQDQLKSSKEAQGKQQEFSGALDIINEMRAIRDRGNLGVGSSATKYLDPKAQKDFGTYEQLGKSLIPYASNIPIRNQQEFNTLAEKLFDPTISDAEASGTLDAMERIIMNSLRSSGGMDVIEESVTNSPKREKTVGLAEIWD